MCEPCKMPSYKSGSITIVSIKTLFLDFHVLSLQKLTTTLLEVESQVQSLQQMLYEIMMEVKSKRAQLDCNSLLRRERELYIYFHVDARRLQKIVEDLENKTAMKRAQH